ncbi:hypothetical protein SAMN05192558_106131 [Actinokineospora alba]|uniref:Uncharacterized protein n=1 Tax=Actinokineospora alba TaxID=504798 RepID=A0A1H0PJ68_9PSEU|nr:hypothetical protein [Actinokineospora alba]TDP65807.1 hypothetical protein C8E96_1298 [Actinokineospora alba]SDI64646.1 hypothetical protein SAMN05421871_106321 [Actinokineospora alba]SDP04698.1 hypothetical protein SAMN05192558_106131 [Actinokineospora alba]
MLGLALLGLALLRLTLLDLALLRLTLLDLALLRLTLLDLALLRLTLLSFALRSLALLRLALLGVGTRGLVTLCAVHGLALRRLALRAGSAERLVRLGTRGAGELVALRVAALRGLSRRLLTTRSLRPLTVARGRALRVGPALGGRGMRRLPLGPPTLLLALRPAGRCLRRCALRMRLPLCAGRVRPRLPRGKGAGLTGRTRNGVLRGPRRLGVRGERLLRLGCLPWLRVRAGRLALPGERRLGGTGRRGVPARSGFRAAGGGLRPAR